MPVNPKERIIRTALQVFLREGYEGAALNEIVRRAGLSKGGVYHHFSSKEELFREALTFIMDGMEKWSIAYFRDCDSAKDLVHSLFRSMKPMRDAFGAILGQNASRARYSFLEILLHAARKQETVRRRMEEIYACARENLRAELRKGQERQEIRSDIDCEALSFEINALIEGTLLLSILDASIDLDTQGERMFENLWKTISVESQS